MRTMNRLTRVFQASRAQDTNTRLQAALAAGTDPTPQDVGALIAQCATEPDFFVLDMLTWALTRHPAGTIVPLLLTALREGSSRQRQAVALQDGSPSVRSLVASYLDEPDLNAAGGLRWAIVRQGTAAIDALTAAGSDAPADPADPTIRRRISEALADIDLPQATAALQDRLTQPDTRAIAALALARRGGGSSHRAELIDTLVTMVVEGDHDTDAAEALAGLTSGQHDGSNSARAEGVHQLLATITPAATVEQRLSIVQALGDLPGNAAHEALTRLAADPDPRVAGTARHLGH